MSQNDGVHTNTIDDGCRDRLNRICVRGFAHSQPINPKVNRNCVVGFARNQPVNQIIFAQNSCYQYDSENEFGGGLRRSLSISVSEATSKVR